MDQSEDDLCHLFQLPDELLLQTLSMLSAKDLCSVMQTCHRLRNLCMTRSVLASSSFSSGWPGVGTCDVYKRYGWRSAVYARPGPAPRRVHVADNGRSTVAGLPITATSRQLSSSAWHACMAKEVCSALSKSKCPQDLFFESPLCRATDSSCSSSPNVVPANPELAGQMLALVERLTGSHQPFVWLLFRPPWSSDTCSKANIFRYMQEISTSGEVRCSPAISLLLQQFLFKPHALEDTVAHKRRPLTTLWRLILPSGPQWEAEAARGTTFCVGRTLALQGRSEDALEWYRRSAEAGCGAAAFELFASTFDTGFTEEQTLSRVQLLHEHAAPCNPSVLVALCHQYIQGNYTQSSRPHAIQFFQDVCRSAAFDKSSICQPDLDDKGKMRFILVDWLVEVVDLKAFSRDTLYLTISIVDRFLQRCTITRKTLQLLGIACMVIAARFQEDEVITIREAAWLTDNTYYYEQVVRTMGQALFATRGQLRVLTHLDFIRLFLDLTYATPETEELVHFVSELALLHVSIGMYEPAKQAAAIYFLAMCTGGASDPWPEVLAMWSGLSVNSIAPCIMAVHKAIFHVQIKDHRGVELSAVRDRYSRRTHGNVASFVPPSQQEIDVLLAAHLVPEPTDQEAETTAATASGDGQNASGSRALRPITNLALADAHEKRARTPYVHLQRLLEAHLPVDTCFVLVCGVCWLLIFPSFHPGSIAG